MRKLGHFCTLHFLIRSQLFSNIFTGGPNSPESPFFPFLPRFPGGPGGPGGPATDINS